MDINVLVGKTLSVVLRKDDVITFLTDTGEMYQMLHHQNCCESVYLEDVCGDFEDIVGSPILVAELVENKSKFRFTENGDEQWSFYKISTVKGDVTLRWYGRSNGYYSTSVSFEACSGGLA